LRRDLQPKKPWVRPQLRTEDVQETLVKGPCRFKPPGQGGTPPRGPRPGGGGYGPAFS